MTIKILICGFTKLAATQIKKDLTKAVKKNSYEIIILKELKEAIEKNLNGSAVLIWKENLLEKEEFQRMKSNFSNLLTILITDNLSDLLIKEINENRLFKVIRSDVSTSILNQFIEEGIQNIKNQVIKKSIPKQLEESLEKEFAIAHEIQKNLLTKESPRWKNLEIVCFSESAKNVGGDLYTYYGTENIRDLISKHLLAVGDVSGKGISAALIMATAISHIDNSMKLNLKLPERAAYLDKLLTPFTKPQKQNCALCLVEFVGVNTSHAFIKVVNAAFIPPYIKRKNGSVEWIEAKGFALGQGLGMQFGYKEKTIGIERGDMIILVSDGIIEANNSLNELFGFDNFYSILNNAPTDSAEKMLSFIQKKIHDFTGGVDQNDDRTIVIVRYH